MIEVARKNPIDDLSDEQLKELLEYAKQQKAKLLESSGESPK